MPRIQPVDPAQAAGKTKELLDIVQKKMGSIPNIMKTMAQSPAVLEAYLGFSGAMATSSLPLALREQIALTVGETNRCGYCVAAHTVIGKKAGLTDLQAQESRQGRSSDPKIHAALQFTRKMVESQASVKDADIAKLREAGYGDTQIAELVAAISLNIFTNYFNHVADPVIDFPAPPPLRRQPLAAGL